MVVFAVGGVVVSWIGVPNYLLLLPLQINTATVGDLVRIKVNASTSTTIGFATIGVTGCAAYDGNPAENQANYAFNLIGDNG